VKDFLHILFGLDVYDDMTPITVGCDWGNQLAEFDILNTLIFIDIPLTCEMTLPYNGKDISILKFDFLAKGHLKPKILQLMGGQHIYFDVDEIQILDYIDNQPGEVIDRYIIQRISAMTKKVMPEDFTFFDNRLDAMTNIKIDYRDHYVTFSGELI